MDLGLFSGICWITLGLAIGVFLSSEMAVLLMTILVLVIVYFTFGRSGKVTPKVSS